MENGWRNAARQGDKSISHSSSLNKMHLVPARIERSFAHIPNAVKEQLFPHTWQRFWSPWDHGSAIRNSSRIHRADMCAELSTNRDICIYICDILAMLFKMHYLIEVNALSLRL